MVAGKVTFSEQSPLPVRSSSKIKPLLKRKGILKKNIVKSNAIVIAKKLSSSASVLSKRENLSPMEKAEEIKAKLSLESPSFVKLMLPSHVSGGFWLGLPSVFCKDHMPEEDKIVILEDESDEKFETKYLKAKNGLSGGWRGFSIAHKLLDGDVLVFQLIEEWILKVHIVRAKGLNEIDGSFDLLNLHTRSTKRLNAGSANAENRIKPKVENCSEIRVKKEVITHSENHVKPEVIKHSEIHVKQEVLTEESSENSEELGWGSTDDIEFSESVDFKDVKCIDDFKIVVEGVNINRLLSSEIRFKYYDLCCKQKSFLHENLLQGLNFKLTVGVILETVNIADAITACRMTSGSCRSDLMNWDKTLTGFKRLGIEVGFLRERIHKLMELVTREESKETTMISKLAEKQTAETEMQNLQKVINTLGREISNLKNPSLFEELFAREAKAPW